MKFNQIIDRAFNRPLLMEPGYAETFFSVLQSRLTVDLKDTETGTSLEDAANADIQLSSSEYGAINRDFRPYAVESGVAIIRIDGTLVHKNGYLNPTSGMTSYSGIESNLRQAAEDGSVNRILFDIDSPGGSATGLFELCKMIKAVEKPTMAFVNETAMSGAYAIAASCDTIVCPEMGGVGSIGVIVAHADFSAQLEASGIAVTLVTRGKHKGDGHPTQKLSEQAFKRIDRQIGVIYEKFTTLVAEHRGIPVLAVKGTEALTYKGEEAVTIGLVDKVMSKDEAFEAFKDGNIGTSSDEQAKTETGVNMKNDPKSTETVVEAPEASADAVSGQAAAVAAARQEGLEAGVAQEKTRALGILNSEEAKGREATALSFYTNDLSTEAALSALGTVPVAGTALLSTTVETQNGPTVAQLAEGAGVEDFVDTGAQGSQSFTVMKT